MNIAFSIETPERVPINSGSHGKHQPTDDGTTPCNLIEKYQKIRSFTLELSKPLAGWGTDCHRLTLHGAGWRLAIGGPMTGGEP